MKRLAVTIGLALVLWLVLVGAVRAWLPTAVVAVLAPACAIALVAALFALIRPLSRDERPLLRRHGFWVVVVGILTSLPMLGACSLVDPWETHYAEVAREMIERRDFLSPWWANEGWFMSKPVLTFWLEALSMIALGVHTGPDQVLAGGAHPEWAVRLPAFALAVVGAYLLYRGVSRTTSRTAGFLGAIALLTMPGYALLSHQAITDMPLIASIAASLGFLVRAFAVSDAAEVPRYPLRFAGRAITLHGGHALAGAVLLLVVPQLLAVLASHRLTAGSPHACTLPGQPACAPMAMAHPYLLPIVQVLLWVPLLVWVVSQLAEETRAARLFVLAAWTAAAFGAMAKGPAAFAVPAAAGLVAIAARRDWRAFRRLEIPNGLLVTALLVGPWYLAVYARHGRGFVDQLVLHHMWGRTLEHLHDTNTGDDVGLTYFIKQLGYATFPWSGLALVALLRARRPLLFGAALGAFTLVSLMGTKFHHYGLVCLPAVAMLVGQWLADRLAEHRRPARDAHTAVALASAAAVTLLVARDLQLTGRFMQLMTYRYDRHWVHTSAFAPWLLATGGLAAAAFVVIAKYRKAAIYALGVVSIGFTAMLLDGYLPSTAGDGGQRALFESFYATRTDQEPLIAYQLNWKGENFYSGNNLAIFIGSGPPMKAYLDKRRAAGETEFFFVTERGRLAHLRAELGAHAFLELSNPESNPEFALARATF